MPLDIHQQIFAAWKTLLASVTTANGFRSNIGATQFVFRSAEQPYGADELPCHNIFYGGPQVTDEGHGCADCVLTINAECFPASAADVVTPVEDIRADLQNLVANNHKSNDQLWLYAVQSGELAAIETTVAGRNISGVSISITVNYSTKEQV